MNNDIRKIREAQMRILFRGSDSYVMQRNITDNDLDRLRLLNIELLRHYLPSLDENNKSRALRTIRQLKRQAINSQQLTGRLDSQITNA